MNKHPLKGTAISLRWLVTVIILISLLFSLVISVKGADLIQAINMLAVFGVTSAIAVFTYISLYKEEDPVRLNLIREGRVLFLSTLVFILGVILFTLGTAPIVEGAKLEAIIVLGSAYWIGGLAWAVSAIAYIWSLLKVIEILVKEHLKNNQPND